MVQVRVCMRCNEGRPDDDRNHGWALGSGEKKKHLPFIHVIFLCSLVWNGGVVFNVGAGAARHGCRLALDFSVLVWGPANKASAARTAVQLRAA